MFDLSSAISYNVPVRRTWFFHKSLEFHADDHPDEQFYDKKPADIIKRNRQTILIDQSTNRGFHVDKDGLVTSEQYH